MGYEDMNALNGCYTNKTGYELNDMDLCLTRMNVKPSYEDELRMKTLQRTH